MESLNPCGTGKDRAVKNMVNALRDRGNLPENVAVVEATSGRYYFDE